MNKLLSLVLTFAFLITGKALSMDAQDADWGHKAWLLQTMPEDKVFIEVDTADKRHSLNKVRHHVGSLFNHVTYEGDRANPDKLIINLARVDSYPLRVPAAVHNFNKLLQIHPKDLVVLKRGCEELNYTPEQKQALRNLIIQTACSLVYSETLTGESSVAVDIGLLPEELKALWEECLKPISHQEPVCNVQPKESTLRKLLVPVTTGIISLGLGYLLAKKLGASEQ